MNTNEPKAILSKAPSGIQGLDEVTGGGLPRGRPTLVCGDAGCGKTLFATEFLARGILEYGEPGVFMSFEESPEELTANASSLGFDLKGLAQSKQLSIDHVLVERSDIEESGEYNLDGLFFRLELAIEEVGAKRVVLDTIESIFSSLPNEGLLRSELRRLFRWLKDRGMTVVITGEKGQGSLTRQGLEEYVSDCVIFLDHRVVNQISTRRLRVVKYRGTLHGTNEYPFLIDEEGISILPITYAGLVHKVSNERVSSGIPRLDEMLGGLGYFKGSTLLLSGTAGTGKTCISSSLVRAACDRGEKCFYFSFEESPEQIVRNMRSLNIDLNSCIEKGLLQIISSRPTAYGLEMLLLALHKRIKNFKPDIIVLDPITNLIRIGNFSETQSMLTRFVDFLKNRGITALFTSLNEQGEDPQTSRIGLSSIIDTWIVLQVVYSGGERNQILSVVKSRGMGHSNQQAEYKLTDKGLKLLDTYVGPHGVLTGSARLAKETEDEALNKAMAEEIVRKQRDRELHRKAFERHMEQLRDEFEAEDAVLKQEINEKIRSSEQVELDRCVMSASRKAFASSPYNGEAATKKTKEQHP